MSAPSSNGDAWLTHLQPASPPDLPRRPDDPRLGESVTFWTGGLPLLHPGQPVVVGFPQDEGVRRNQGRTGAAAAPGAIRQHLYRLTPWDGTSGADLEALHLIDLGNVRVGPDLEASQAALGEVIAAVLARQAVPIVLGGGHETAYGHYLGYVGAGLPVAIVNLDAHLDVRPTIDGRGHSGSPFRQAQEHPLRPLPPERYACLGLQPASVSRQHLHFVRDRGGRLLWADEVRGRLEDCLVRQCEHFRSGDCLVYVSLDSDVACMADVPGVSAANPLGLSGRELAACAARLGALPGVASFDLVEINPGLDRDQQSARWAALVVWSFLAGLALRR